MIVSESDVLLAALDRRLQVDRVAALDVVAPLAGREQSSAAATATAVSGFTGSADGVPGGARDALAASAAAASSEDVALLEHLPLGQIVAARVVALPGPRQVLADIGSLRVALAWPGGNGPLPQPGDPVALRVLAHAPMLLFEDANAATTPARNDDATTRLSASARSLQTQTGVAGPARFTVPILLIESTTTHDDIATAQASTTAAATASPDAIGLDAIIVGAGASLVDPPATAAASVGAAIDPATVMPLVLQGPAWAGQEVELVVRRERADEAFDNPALDQWCGELVIDLPHLGRVAGHLAWSMQGLRIRLEGQDAASVAAMNTASAELATGLSEVALPVLSLSVGQLFSDTALGHGLSSVSTGGPSQRWLDE